MNFSLRRIEHDPHASILCLCQLANEDDQRRDEACLACSSQYPSPLCQKPQTQRGRVPKQEISDRPLAKMQCEQVGEELWLG